MVSLMHETCMKNFGMFFVFFLCTTATALQPKLSSSNGDTRVRLNLGAKALLPLSQNIGKAFSFS